MGVRTALAGAAAGVWLASVAVTATSAQEVVSSWDTELWNPRPSADDVVLPMPCGGQIAFREIPIPHGSGLLDDRYIELGEESGDYNYLRGRRYAHLSGPFVLARDRVEGFYLAKYELAQIQYDVVMAADRGGGEPCPRPRRRDFVAAGGLSWFDAVAFGRAYTEWLLANAPDALPAVDEVPGFVRPPTEAEWEYAVRGGAAVDPAAFREPRFAIEGASFDAVAATAEAGSANGRVQPIGTRGPNPLALHDVYGNVAELVLEPFRLTRLGRLHGQIGGAVKKGGDAKTPAALITSGTRQEVPFFDRHTGAAFTDPVTGLRPAIAAPAITSEEAVARLGEDLDAIARSHLDDQLALREDEAFQALERAAADPRVGELAPTLRGARSSFEAVRAARNEQAEAAVGAMTLAGAAVCARIETLVDSGRAWAELFAIIKRDIAAFEPRNDAERARLAELRDVKIPETERKGAAIRAEVVANRDVYASVIEVLTNNYGIEVVERQADALLREYAARESSALLACVPRLLADARHRLQEGRLPLERWAVDFSAIEP